MSCLSFVLCDDAVCCLCVCSLTSGVCRSACVACWLSIPACLAFVRKCKLYVVGCCLSRSMGFCDHVFIPMCRCLLLFFCIFTVQLKSAFHLDASGSCASRRESKATLRYTHYNQKKDTDILRCFYLKSSVLQSADILPERAASIL